MADTFDLDALEVEEEHAEPFEFVYRDEKFVLPVATAMDWQDQLALETANPLDSLRLIMGAEQYDRFRALPMSAARLSKLIEAWGAHQGTSLGESPASSTS